MKKKAVANPIAVVLILVLLIIFLRQSGNNTDKPTASVTNTEKIIEKTIYIQPEEDTDETPDSPTYTCTSSDEINVMTLGYCEDSYHMLGFSEECAGSYAVKEYYCDGNNICQYTVMGCPPGTFCNGGRCV